MTGNEHFIPMVGVKMSYMSVGVNKGMGLSDGQVCQYEEIDITEKHPN